MENGSLILAFLALIAACGAPPALPDRDGDGVPAGEDCDDAHAGVYPGAPEVCDTLDNDCNGAVDDDPIDGLNAFRDADLDDWGGEPIVVCRMGRDVADRGGDCDDDDVDVNPDMREDCAPIDRDCDGDATAGAADARPSFADADGDGFFGTELAPSCEVAPGASATADDCDDTDPSIHPGAFEACDSIDQDCDGDLGFDAIVGTNAVNVDHALRITGRTARICLPPGTWQVDAELHDRDVTFVGAGTDLTTVTSEGRLLGTTGGRVVLQRLALRSLTGRAGPAIWSEGSEVVLEDVLIEGVRHMDPAQLLQGAILRAVDGQTRLSRVHVQGVYLPRVGSVEAVLVDIAGGRLEIDDVEIEGFDLPPLYSMDDRFPLIRLTDRATLAGIGLTAGDLHADPDVANHGHVTLLHAEDSIVDLEQVDLSRVTTQGSFGVLAAGWRSQLTLSQVTVQDVQTHGWSGPLFYMEDSDLRVTDLDVDGVVHDGEHAGTVLLVTQYPGTWTLDRVRITNSRGGNMVRLLAIDGRFRATNLISAGNTIKGYGTGSWRTSWLETWPLRGPEEVLPDAGALLDVTIENATFEQDHVVYGSDRGATLASTGRANVSLTNVHVDSAYVADEYRHTISGGNGDITLDHVTFEGPDDYILHWWGTGRITRTGDRYGVSPGFVDTTSPDPAAWDLHLLSTSPLVDTGAHRLTDPDGTRSDVGAYGGPGAGGW